MKTLLACISFALFAFFYFGVVLHTSDAPQYLGKYSAKYMLVVVVVTFAALPWAWATRSLISDSEVALRSGRTVVIRGQHKVLFYSLLFALLCLGAEGALRLTFVKPPPKTHDLYHPYLQNALNPTDTELHVNNHGFRGEDMAMAKPNGTFRIFVLGGSTVLSSRVDYEKSHVRLLAHSLQDLFAQAPGDDRKVEVFNAGNHWHTSQHSLMKYLFQVKDFDPDLVIVWHGINDLYRSCSPPRFSRGVYQADYSHFWGPTAEMVMKHEQLPDPPPLFSFGESLLARRLSSFTNALYQDFRKDDPIRLVDVDEFASLAAFERNMRGIIHAVRGDGKRVVFATQPYLYREGLSPEELSNVKFGKFMCVTSDGEAPNLASMALGMKNFNDATRKIAKEAGVPLIELAAALPKTGEYFLDDVHYTEKANAVVARSIHDFLANSRLLE